MKTIISYLANKLGISESVAHHGVRILLGFLQRNAEGTAFAQFISALPGAKELLAEHEPAAGGGRLFGGLVERLGGMIGGGGSDVAHTATKLQAAGLQPSQLHAFIQEFVEKTKSEVGEETVKRVLGALSPFLETTPTV